MSSGRRAAPRSRTIPRRLVAGVALGVAAAIAVPVALSVGLSGASTPGDARARTSAVPIVQSLQVPAEVVAAGVAHDMPTVTDQVAVLSASGTNADWAKLVLVLGEFPVTDQNVTVITRWMRQENYTDSWWQRNNPLNNGWGSGGGGGLGSYSSLVSAAENAADALRSNPGYGGITASFDASADPDSTAAAIWASPWASGHYANGAHWSEAPVPVATAPPEAWAAG